MPCVRWSQGRGRRENWFESDIIRCKFHNDGARSCNFAAHKKCWKVHCELKPLSVQPCCDDITFQFRPAVITAMLNDSAMTNRSDLLKDLKRTGSLRKVSCKRKRRYVSANRICKMCGDEVVFSQRAHLMQHCTAILATPVSADKRRDWRAFANRCFEIGRRKLSFESSQDPPKTHLNDHPAWGSRDGQSLTEVDPDRSE